MKRLTIELPLDHYDFLRRKALSEGTSVSALIRNLIDECRSHSTSNARKNYKDDSFYSRHGPFNDSADLSERHDAYLYEEESE
jgi:hypothetical protein